MLYYFNLQHHRPFQHNWHNFLNLYRHRHNMVHIEPDVSEEDIKRIQLIAQQLVEYTGKNFNLVVSNYPPDNAFSLPCKISIGVQMARLETDALAGVMAHEWGHSLSNHWYTPENHFQRSFNEAEADKFAAKFLAKYNYDIEPFVRDMTQRFPEIPGDTHGTHAERAQRLRDAYIEAQYQEVDKQDENELKVPGSFNGLQP